MNFRKLSIILLVSIVLVTCTNDKKESVPVTQLVPTKDKKDNLANYPDNKLFLYADSLEITQVNPNVTRKIVYLDDLMVTIVEFINGPMAAPDPFHSHTHEQISYIAEGECLVLIGDRQMKLGKGDIFAVPSNVPHSVQSLTPTLKLIDSFAPIREDFIKK